MAGIPQVTKTGPRSYTPTEPIAGGQLVEARTGGRVGVAAAGSLKVLGVAVTDGVSPDAAFGQPTVVGGFPTVTAVAAPHTVGVAYGGIEVPVTYSATAAFGDALVSTGAGKVGPAGTTPDARTIVGRCAEPAGVTAANTVALMRTV
ncbi:hypothetical protein GCM10027047_01600 [Rhodococcus aerolatus]